MKWARFGVSATCATPCVNMRRGSCDCGGRWTFSSLWSPLLPGQAASLVLSKNGRRADLPKVAKTTDALFPWSGFFEGGLSGEGMHVPDWVSRSFYTYVPTYRLVRTLPSELIGGGRTRMPPTLGFKSLFLNQPLPWRALRLAFQILSTTKRYSFSLEICWASKSTTQLIFTIEN
jgi:hypothetical protein